MALIKPQFEAGRDKVGKKGVVRDPAVHLQVIQNVQMAATNLGFYCWGLDFSPIKGPEGNIEYLLWLGKQPADAAANPVLTPEKAVAAAFGALNKDKTDKQSENIQKN